LAVLGAPTSIGLVPGEDGEARPVDLAPRVLREHGLIARLRANDRGDVAPPDRYLDRERPAGRVRNEEDVGAYCRELAKRIAQSRRDGEFVVLLGGDCSIILAALLGLRDVDPEPPGLVYLDAHADFALLDESPSGSACSMSLALALGREDRPLASLHAPGPLTATSLVAHVGRRDEERTSYGADGLAACGVLDLPMSAVRSNGARHVVAQALARASASPSGFWVHLDTDVLDPAAFAATADPAPRGINFSEATTLLEELVRHPRAVGLQLTLYDPTLDPTRSGAEDLTRMLERALRGRQA
jgi:arginase